MRYVGRFDAKGVVLAERMAARVGDNIGVGINSELTFDKSPGNEKRLFAVITDRPRDHSPCTGSTVMGIFIQQ